MSDPARAGALDGLIVGLDRALRTLSGVHVAHRPSPARTPDADAMSEADWRHASGLMRVNHAGEVCAQALYHGQAMVARDDETRDSLLAAADEEEDHLAWCGQRLRELDARTSVLNPVWYAASFALGAGAGLLGDRVSLGFVHATEDRVAEHLDRHLDALPPEDERSREVVRAMRDDETRHGADALRRGGARFPAPVLQGMALVARLMTGTSYRI